MLYLLYVYDITNLTQLVRLIIGKVQQPQSAYMRKKKTNYDKLINHSSETRIIITI